jgi:hypothetical protein
LQRAHGLSYPPTLGPDPARRASLRVLALPTKPELSELRRRPVRLSDHRRPGQAEMAEGPIARNLRVCAILPRSLCDEVCCSCRSRAARPVSPYFSRQHCRLSQRPLPKPSARSPSTRPTRKGSSSLSGERHGESNRDRLRHIFKDVPVLYGFTSKVPLGRCSIGILSRQPAGAGVRTAGEDGHDRAHLVGPARKSYNRANGPDECTITESRFGRKVL